MRKPSHFLHVRFIFKYTRLWLGLLSFGALAVNNAGAESTFDERSRAEMLAKFADSEKQLTAEIQKAPESVSLYSSRGDARLFLGRSADAVADYERMIAIDPAEDAPHWRLGIAYYFAGEFAKSARQFAKYHAYDGRDRENGIWKFLAQARAESVEKARANMLVYEHFDREPFPALYEMLAGARTGAEVFAEIERKGLSRNRSVMFFANYYVGLNESLLGDQKAALDHLRRAVDGGWTGESEPEYMWQVSRLQYEALAKSSSAP